MELQIREKLQFCGIKKNGKPIYNAIVWQDRRTQEYCKSLKNKNYENTFRKKTGLFIDPYFSATKIKWILDNVKISKKLLKSNNLLFGTVDTFLIWKLTKGKHHLTEATNASRTMLFNINNNKSDNEITQSRIILHNSHWAFIFILLLLAAEWILRRRNGMI